MAIRAFYTKHMLEYYKPARTSRGEMQHHHAYYITLESAGRAGVGEASPLPGLSIDDRPDFEAQVQLCCDLASDGMPLRDLPLDGFPALRFAFESASAALQHEAKHKLFETDFLKGASLPINGLVWMDNCAQMLASAFEKAEQGFECIKFKIGALDFDEECRMLEAFRKRHNAFRSEIRLDANGAFLPGEALEKLSELGRFDVHSIEQPIKQQQWEMMQELCAKSPVPVVLDEELIGTDAFSEGDELLSFIRPAYIILKPTLAGGFAAADEWIRKAQKAGIGWWATSALESNIGLNAIAQWVSAKSPEIYQGLGTGSLYRNNIDSPLEARAGRLFYNNAKGWGRIPG